jgi:penicillin-binding protein 2
MSFSRVRVLAFVLIGFGCCVGAAAALDAPTTQHRIRVTEKHLAEPHRAASHHAAVAKSTAKTASVRKAHRAAPTREPARLTTRGNARATARIAARSAGRHHHSYERFTASSFANSDLLAGDVTAGEDPVVRQAAIDALGDMNGTAVVIDPSNGRILAMVNQKLALSPGAEPCSTIKLTVAMAALSEKLVTRDTPVQLAGFRMNMTQALAKSNNLYFE